MTSKKPRADAEYRVIGPPGCGKTTWLGRQVENAVDKNYRVLITSQTKAAAAEITGRRLPIPDENLGTLHSHCYHILGKPELVLSHIEDWNEENPGLKLTMSKTNEVERKLAGEIPDDTNRNTEGDALMAEYTMARSRMETSDKELVRAFGNTYEDWKQRNALMDFQDLIEICLREVETAPGDPDVIFVDEAQDLDQIEMKLIRKWGEKAGQLIVVGDPDQCIYSWRGASPEAFITPVLPSEQTLVLSQSYRVPVRIHQKAIEWIEKIETRMTAEYYPRDHEGEIQLETASWMNPYNTIRTAEQHLAQGKSVMFLTSCAYMLKTIIQELRDRHIPFHNPFRRNNGAWNPLAKRGNTITTGERILAFLALSERGMWTAQDIRRWSDALSLKEHLTRGARARIKELANSEDGGVSTLEMEKFFSEELMNAGLSGDLHWFQEHLNAAKRDTAGYPLGIAMAQGSETLAKPPGIIVGTIHCSPGDEPVLTTNGWVNMEDLMPDWHRLPGHCRESNRMTWGGTNSPGSDGFDFVRSERHYEGKLVVIEAGDGRTRITPNHRIPVSLNGEFSEKWCCYLMRKGEWWRIGVCTTAHTPYRSGGVGGRLGTEQADEGWILSIHENRREAAVQEVKWQGKYGIPGTTFMAAKNRMLCEEDLVEIHQSFKGEISERVTRLFEDTGLQREEPLYSRADTNRNNPKRKTNGHIFTTAAGNLLPLSGYIDVLTPHPKFQTREDQKEHRTPLTKPASIHQEEFRGAVYGLDVPPYHHYISGGIVVHNSVKGGEADVVYLFPDLSLARNMEFQGELAEQQNSIIRLFYVGMTRARETLVLCSPTGKSAVEFR